MIRSYLRSELEPYRETGKFHGKYLIFSANEIQIELDRRDDLNYKRLNQSLFYPHLTHN